MMKKMTAALAALSLLFAVGAYAEDNSALPGTRGTDAAAAVSTPAAQVVSAEEAEEEEALSP